MAFILDWTSLRQETFVQHTNINTLQHVWDTNLISVNETAGHLVQLSYDFEAVNYINALPAINVHKSLNTQKRRVEKIASS